jgi:hypothetical protein
MNETETKIFGKLNQQEDNQMPLPDLDKALSDESRLDIVNTTTNSDRIELKPVVEDALLYHVAKLSLEEDIQ